MSGRTGSFTYRQSRGQTIVSQYQPIVKNPNTQGQQTQRARFKLMSQLAAIMAAGFGSFIIKTRPEKQRPTQRNAFMQVNMPLVEVVSSADTATAKIPMEQLKLTSSFKALPNMNLAANGQGINVNMEKIPSEVKTIRLVVVGYTGNNGTQAAIQSITDVPVTAGEINHDIATDAGKFTVLGFGLIPTETTAAKIDLDNIHTPADENFISAVDLDRMVSEGTMLETMTVGGNIDVPVS